MAALIRGPGQMPISENACREAIESALDLPGIPDVGFALYDAEGSLRLVYPKQYDNQPHRDLALPLDPYQRHAAAP